MDGQPTEENAASGPSTRLLARLQEVTLTTVKRPTKTPPVGFWINLENTPGAAEYIPPNWYGTLSVRFRSRRIRTT